MINSATHSLRARLLLSLMAAIVLAALAQLTIAYRIALEEADEMFDYHMQQVARSVRSGLPIGGASPSGSSAPDEENDDLIVQAWSSDGTSVLRTSPTITLPRLSSAGFTTAQVQGVDYRIYTSRSDTQVVAVGQDLSARQAAAGSLAVRTAGPIALMMPILGLVVWWVVSRSLAPLARMRTQVASRRADDISPVSEADLPEEIYPLVHELNLLFARVGLAFKAQQDFVGDAAHELRSPLAAIKLQAQALQRAVDEDSRGVALTRLLGGIDRSTRLVEQLLVLARQEAGVLVGPTHPISLAREAGLAVADSVPVARIRSIDVGIVRADPGWVMGSAEAMAILLRNLIDNAIKYSSPSGRVDVEVVDSGHEVLLTVEDTGPGIATDQRHRVLDRFYRVAGADGTGSGLGLAIVHRIAALHLASVTLDDSPLLGGLRVAVRFPIARVP